MVTKENSDSPDEQLVIRRHRIIYQMRLSALYHQKRERFFDIVDKLVACLLAVSATAAFTSLFQPYGQCGKVIAAFTALLSMIPLVFNPAQRARHHNQLAQDYRRLLAECEVAGQRWTDEQCNGFSSKSLQIAASEPTPLTALVADCQNQLALAFDENQVADLKFYHHLFKHWIDLRPDPCKENSA